MLLTPRRSAMVLSVSLIMSLASLAHSEPAASLPPLLAEWMSAEKSAGDIWVSFQQSRSLPTLKVPVTARGVFWRMKDGRFRWQLGQPPVLILVSDGKTVRLREEASQEWQQLDPKDRRVSLWFNFLSGQDMSAEALAKSFTTTIASATSERVAFVLQPKSVFMRKHLHQMELHIHPQTKHLLQLHLVQGDDSSVTLVFDRPRAATETPDLFK